jgi:hypothetical protein
MAADCVVVANEFGVASHSLNHETDQRLNHHRIGEQLAEEHPFRITALEVSHFVTKNAVTL